jgi:hypothetical protein
MMRMKEPINIHRLYKELGISSTSRSDYLFTLALTRPRRNNSLQGGRGLYEIGNGGVSGGWYRGDAGWTGEARQETGPIRSDAVPVKLRRPGMVALPRREPVIREGGHS